jgi:hypothetical protein
MSRFSFDVQRHFASANVQLNTIGQHLQRRPPDEAAALAVLASALQEVSIGLWKLTKFIDEQH